MKTLLSVVLCALVSTHAIAANTYAKWQTIDGQRRIVYSEVTPTHLITTDITTTTTDKMRLAKNNQQSTTDPTKKQPLAPSNRKSAGPSQTTQPLSLVEQAIHQNRKKMLPSTQGASTTKTAKVSIKKTVPVNTLKVWPRERYIDAMSRWLHNDGFNNIAWELPDTLMVQLNQKPAHLLTLPDPYRLAVSKLAQTLNVKMYLHVRYYPEKLAALVPWEGDSTLMMARGDNLEMALKTLSTTYNWQWIARNQQGQSYRAKNNYPFPAPYPIATPKGDISQALGKILAPYPVIANLLDNTRTVLIMDEK